MQTSGENTNCITSDLGLHVSYVTVHRSQSMKSYSQERSPKYRAGQGRTGSGVENMFTSQWSLVWKPQFLQTKYKKAKQKLYSINFNNNFLNERNQTTEKGMTLAWLKLLPTPHPTSRALSLKSLPTV